MVSIIIPIYNAEKWLKECLDSILRQSYSDFEVIMIDDGSKDCSAVICKEFVDKDPRFHYYYQQNAGVSVARNTGLYHAQGEWVSFIDSDDMVDRDFLAEMMRYTDRFDAVNCDYATEFGRMGKQGKVTSISKERLIKETILEKCKRPTLWSLIYRRVIITDNNLAFTPGCIRNEDYEFFMKYLTMCTRPIVRNGYVGYFYRQNPQSVMHQKRSRDSVLMSLDATGKVGEAVEKIGVISDKTLLVAFSVTTFLYLMSHEENIEMYNELHSLFPVKSYVRLAFCNGSLRVRGAAALYQLLGRKLFYKIFSLYQNVHHS